MADAAPTITLSANGTRLRTPATITLSARASDADGSIAKVDFYQSGALIGSATTAPYEVTVNQVSADTLTFYAKATDNSGLVTQSNSVTVVISNTPAVYYIHGDHIDTPRVVTDQANKVVWRWDGADPFGAGRPDEDPDGDGTRFTLNLRFPGQYFDRETGLHYNYFRDYDPSAGRYVQSDPIGLDGGLNSYTYALGNPTGGSDPNGLQALPAPQPSPNTPTTPGFPQGPAANEPNFRPPGSLLFAPIATNPWSWGAALFLYSSNAGDPSDAIETPPRTVSPQAPAPLLSQRETSGHQTRSEGLGSVKLVRIATTMSPGVALTILSDASLLVEG